MKTIASFTVDHRKIRPGMYISRVDGDVTTYDLRMRKPNTGDLISNAAMHSLEHLFATMIRNSDLGEQILYFVPMGCQTGFYLLVRHAEHQRVIDTGLQTLQNITEYDGPMPGASEIECGNFRNLDVELAKIESRRHRDAILGIVPADLQYAQ